MNTEFIKVWTDELRNGGRAQVQNNLHVINEDGTEGFCCLGVAEDLLCQIGVATRIEWPEAIDDSRPSMYAYTEDGGGDEETGVLTEKAQRYIGFDDGNPDIVIASYDTDRNLYDQCYEDGMPTRIALAELNDDGFTFEQIADLIDYFYGGN